MQFRAAKSVVLASILSDFLQLFGMIYIGLNVERDVDSTVLCNYVVKIGNF